CIVFTSPCPRRGRRDSCRDGRGSTLAHPRCLFLRSASSGRRCVKPLPNPLLGQGEGIRTGEGFKIIYQRIRFAPQVRPPPQAFSITMLFSFIRPRSMASSSAIGTDAAEVLP